MGFWGGVANFGLASKGFDEYTDARTDRATKERALARSEELAGMELDRARRDDELAKSVRNIARRNGLGGEGAMPATQAQQVEVPMQGPMPDGEALPPGAKTIPGLPEQVNRQGMYEEMAQAYEQQGKLDVAAKIRQGLKAAEQEGFTDLVKGVASGEEQTAIAQRFNQKGKRRIVNGEKQGDAYVFQYEDGKSETMNKAKAEDLAEKLGIFKREKPTVVPRGGVLADDRGNIVARGEPVPVAPRNVDPLSPEGLAARRGLEDYKASLTKRTGADGKLSKIREVEALAEHFGGDVQKAIEFAYGMKDKDRTSAVMQMATLLKSDDSLSQDPAKLIAEAEKMVDALRTKETAKSRGGQRPKAPGKGDGPSPPSDKPPAAYPNAKKARDGKWYVKQADGWYLVQ